MDRQLIDLAARQRPRQRAELARQVGLSSPAVHERVGKLEGAGVITAYRAVIDPAAVGLGVTALISVIESDAVDDTGVEEACGRSRRWRTAGGSPAARGTC